MSIMEKKREMKISFKNLILLRTTRLCHKKKIKIEEIEGEIIDEKY